MSEPFTFLAACALGLSLLVIDTAARMAPHQTDIDRGDPCLIGAVTSCDLLPAAFAGH